MRKRMVRNNEKRFRILCVEIDFAVDPRKLSRPMKIDHVCKGMLEIRNVSERIRSYLIKNITNKGNLKEEWLDR